MTRQSTRALGAIACIVLLTGAVSTPLPDPTRPANYFSRKSVVEELPREIVNWNLSAVRISAQGKSAIINGQLVKEGDRIGQGKVVEINHDGVVLDYNRQEFVVNLMPYDIKRNAPAAN